MLIFEDFFLRIDWVLLLKAADPVRWPSLRVTVDWVLVTIHSPRPLKSKSFRSSLFMLTLSSRGEGAALFPVNVP